MKKKLLRIVIIAFMVLWIKAGYTQDPVFTQYFQAPLNINPAFAGNTYAPVVHINTRIEWPAIDFMYNTYALSVDRFFEKYKFGAGFFIVSDNSGNGIYKRFRLEGIVSYRLEVSESRFLKMGMSLGYGYNSLDWDRLVFADMLTGKGGVVLPGGSRLPTKEERPEELSGGYLDISTGLLFYSETFYGGIAVKHANGPDNFLSANANDNIMPVRLAIHAGAQFDISGGDVYHYVFYSPQVLYVYQAGMQQVAVHNTVDFGSIFAGIGYRYNFGNADAVLFSAGVKKDMFKIAYSFDYTVSALTISTGGAHEIGVSINFDKSTLFKAPPKYSDCFEMFR